MPLVWPMPCLPQGKPLGVIHLSLVSLLHGIGSGELEKEMATHFSILAWKIPWTEELGRLQSMGSLESDTT